MVEVTDHVEQAFGDPTKAVTKVPKVKAEIKPEVKVETPEKKPEVKPEVKAEEKKPGAKPEEKAPEKIVVDDKKFFDPSSKKKEIKTPEIKKDEKGVEHTQEQIDYVQNGKTYKESHDKFQKFLNSPEGQIWQEATEAGASIFDVMGDLAVDYTKVDYANASDTEKEFYDRQIATAYFKSKGLKDKALETEVSDFIESAEDRSKRRDREDMKSFLDNNRKEKIGNYFKGKKESQKEISQRQNAVYADIDKAIEEIKSRGNLYGMQLADDGINIEKFNKSCHSFFDECWNEDGTVNTAFVISSMFYKEYGKEKARQAALNIAGDAEHKMLAKVSKLDAEEASIKVISPKKEVFDREKENEAAFG